MKRDNDYIRKLLIEVEADEKTYLIVPLTIGAGDEPRKKNYHAELLCDAGLLTHLNEGVYRLTNQGHDFVEAIRDEGIWNNTKAKVAEAGGSATLEILKSLAIGFLKKKISQHTDIEL